MHLADQALQLQQLQNTVNPLNSKVNLLLQIHLQTIQSLFCTHQLRRRLLPHTSRRRRRQQLLDSLLKKQLKTDLFEMVYFQSID
jgi:hypothetical protein